MESLTSEFSTMVFVPLNIEFFLEGGGYTNKKPILSLGACFGLNYAHIIEL